eukprot:g9442.t1
MREVALLTSSAGDGLATVVDVLTGTQLSQLKNCWAQPGSTALIAGDFVVSAQVKGTAVHFWAWGTEQPRLKCHAPEKLGPLAVSGDGWLCAGGGVSGRIYLWEVASGTLLRAWDAHYKAVSALTFSPDGGFLYSGGEDAMVSSWNMLAAVDPEGGEALKGGGGGGGGIRSSLPATWTASEHSLPVTCLHAAKGGGRVYSCSLDRSAKAWDACSGRLLLSVACPAFLRAVTTDPAEVFLFAAGGGGIVFQLDISATAIAATASDAAVTASGIFLEDPEHEDHDPSWGLRLPGGDRDGGGSGGGAERRGLQELHGHEKAVTSLSVTSDSTVLVSASEDGTTRSWHVASRQCVQKTEGVGGGGKGVAVSQVLLLPIPEALMIVRAAGRGGGSGGCGRRRQSVPLAPFDKFMRISTGKSKVEGSTAGFDFSAGCTPVVLKSAPCPRGRLGGVFSRGPDAPAAASGLGVRAALEALEGWVDGSQSGTSGSMTKKATRGEEGGEGRGEERAAKVARLEEEIGRLRSENLRWQQVNNTLFQKLGAASKRK